MNQHFNYSNKSLYSINVYIRVSHAKAQCYNDYDIICVIKMYPSHEPTDCPKYWNSPEKILFERIFLNDQNDLINSMRPMLSTFWWFCECAKMEWTSCATFLLIENHGKRLNDFTYPHHPFFFNLLYCHKMQNFVYHTCGKVKV